MFLTAILYELVYLVLRYTTGMALLQIEYYSSIIHENCIFQKFKGHTHTHTHKCIFWWVYEPNVLLIGRKMCSKLQFFAMGICKNNCSEMMHLGFFRRPVEECKANRIHTMKNFPILLPTVCEERVLCLPNSTLTLQAHLQCCWSRTSDLKSVCLSFLEIDRESCHVRIIKKS